MAVFNLSVSEAMDIVDAYGPDKDLWPSADAAALDHLLSSSEEFSDYVADTKRIEDMLENWDEADDGVNIDANDLDPGENDEPEDSDDDDVEDEDFGSGGASAPPPSPDDDEEDDPQILEVDGDDIADAGDMDKMLSDFIRKEISVNGKTSFNVFTKDYDKLLDLDVPDTTSLEDIEIACAKATGPLQKDLRRLIAARSQAKRLPGLRKGRLHGPNLHKILAGDDRVFYRREQAPTLDTAITLLLDCSGSMQGNRMRLAAETSYALATVLNRLGIAFECIGFTTAGRDHPDYAQWSSQQYQKELAEAALSGTIHRFHPIAIPKFKAFEERWTAPVQRRLAHAFNKNGYEIGKVDMGGTPESCGNEFAARRLLQRKEKRKIMITMTDGESTLSPYNNGYDPYLAKRRSTEVVQMIEASGIDLIGIGIQHAGPTNYYSNSMVINSLEEMPKQLLGLLKGLLIGK